MNLRASPASLVFKREGGGHVGFYLGEDASSYQVLGGNQDDAVSVARLPKTRLIASRCPKCMPVIGGPVACPNGAARLFREAMREHSILSVAVRF